MNLDFWNLWNSRNISKLFSRMIVFVTILTTVLIGGIMIYHEIANYKKIEKLQREKYITEQKILIKDIVLSEARYIMLRKRSMEQEYINELKFNVEQAYEMCVGLYNELGLYSLSDKKKLLKKITSFLKSKDHFSKIFIGSMDGLGIYYPGHPQYENTNLLRHTDVHGNKVIESELEFLRDKAEGFIFYGQDNLPQADSLPVKKVVYLKKFEPLNWYFGGKIYLEDHYNIFRKDITEKISSVRFKYSGYIFINHTNGTPLVMDGQIYNGNYNFLDGSDARRHGVFLKELEAAKISEEGGYFSYHWNKMGETEFVPKLSYIVHIKELDWLVGAGFYLNDIDQQLTEQKAVLKQNLQGSIAKIVFILIFVLLLESVLLIYFDKYYKNDFNNFFVFFKNASEKYEKVDSEAFHFEEFRKTANAVNTMIDKHEEIHLRLAEEQERATNSDKLKTAFLANMSHEIRTPMNAIVGFSDLLGCPDESLKQDEIIHYIKSSSHQLLKLIDDIVDISKMESHQFRIIKREFALDGFLKSIEVYADQFLSKKQTDAVVFRTEYEFPSDFRLNTDELRLKQVVLNLLGNAFKFTSQGTVKLHVSLEEKGMFFSVKDTGIGIPENEHELVFERFRQSETISGSNFGGTGLGLAISKNIIELLGGEIRLKSKQGKGSEFYFTIPV
ncbi:MAG: hypothetical protein A2W90_06070 [Bacteroidetes bacterium GWF2_42_66]|nr:MAG: hypothetical protein A2W92_01450 [Bacteroidetes bacterium GWA2_42_15]OFY03607.1 MAG: hypothetical protein A2W89_18795 [Bacteroidetes bacterium GWE2_42_39]OFY45972.1 MAG: hypothetical protein A2W90_06070 [Bacteroidetes bacterium GWF2_42_66]HBL75217.1 hypothetical protein [Prolixibacteraceae bacterium]HCR90800.1 hypothetical protein [Prolixibacteraceae bacterium]